MGIKLQYCMIIKFCGDISMLLSYKDVLGGSDLLRYCCILSWHIRKTHFQHVHVKKNKNKATDQLHLRAGFSGNLRIFGLLNCKMSTA